MRMIDADALLRKICGDSCGCEPDECGYIDEYRHERCKAGQYVANAPTVDAIPVDWLTERINETANSPNDKDIELNHALFWTSVEWERWKKENAVDRQ